METKVEKREQWRNKREYILAVAGNVVGLGNVWRFPYLCYKNGGGVFLLPYLFFAVLCGVPIFLLETVIGQYTQEGAITCWTNLSPLSQGPLCPGLLATIPGTQVVYVTAVFPYVMLVILLVRGLTLPGAWQGVVYYLYPEPSRLADLQVWMEACAQVLFSYGVASGTLITLGSYNKVKNNCYRDSLWLCVLNSCTSLGAGFAVFSALGFMAQVQGVPINMVVDSGPGLAFIAFPQAVAMMPLPQFWAACFFIMLIMLGLDTVFAGLETITSSVIDMFPGTMRKPWRREIFLLLFCSICFIIQIPLTTQGGVYLFQLVDYYGPNGASILFVSLVQCVAVGWAFGAERMCDAVEEMTGQRPLVLFKLCWRYFTPLICMVCFICSFLDYTPLTFGDYVYPDWSYYLGWVMALSSVVVIPIWAIGKICLTKGSLRQRLLVLWHPVSDHVRPKKNKEMF
ncbi:sodium- and chloride-dependent GABA transporter 2 isoform X3 [Hippoglossus stenolepis]|uniref:sodium- and chloride-dependent GABA transporter 2 isoform X3 n=1 Tax=Hippoglossus stenolepis TaxID=195615 RepID=UPI00159C05F1|nr:sodium- and chloride-dependent GABA transporter 2 isoform X3 [Hippoglossus stenolepis]